MINKKLKDKMKQPKIIIRKKDFQTRFDLEHSKIVKPEQFYRDGFMSLGEEMVKNKKEDLN